MHMPRHYRTTTTTTTGPSRAGEKGGGSPADCVFLHGNWASIGDVVQIKRRVNYDLWLVIIPLSITYFCLLYTPMLYDIELPHSALEEFGQQKNSDEKTA